MLSRRENEREQAESKFWPRGCWVLINSSSLPAPGSLVCYDKSRTAGSHYGKPTPFYYKSTGAQIQISEGMHSCVCLLAYTNQFRIHPIKKAKLDVMINVPCKNAYVHLDEPNMCACEHALNCDKGGWLSKINSSIIPYLNRMMYSMCLWPEVHFTIYTGRTFTPL